VSSLPKIRRIETIFERGIVRLISATMESDVRGTFEQVIEEHGSGAVVLAYDESRRTALVIKQFRPAVAHSDPGYGALVEPMGGLLDGDKPDVCARREAMEEAGVMLDSLDPVATVWTLPSVSTERLSLFLAHYSPSQRVGFGGGLIAENEHIIVAEIALSELREFANSGTIIDLRLLVLIQALELRRPDLFSL
jgi:nudix-type nucleoside diphosphatase (YffH/AdpP family)